MEARGNERRDGDVHLEPAQLAAREVGQHRNRHRLPARVRIPPEPRFRTLPGLCFKEMLNTQMVA